MPGYDEQLQLLIESALVEDIGDGDHSTLSCIPSASRGNARLKIKDEGILAGVEVGKKIFLMIDPSAEFRIFKKDGETMVPGDVAFEVNSFVHTILGVERLVLNTMQRMSGIATLTRTYTQKLAGYHTRLLDTRKTTPNFRLLEKEAVRIGGGLNHRMGLYDMIMLKDNHIDYAGGLEQAISNAYEYVQKEKPGLKIEVETRSLDEVRRILVHGKVDRIMLDNFTPAQVTEALLLVKGSVETEASGGIDLDNITDYAKTGVDFVSAGALIHQARSLDLSLKAFHKSKSDSKSKMKN
ncbi:MAG TPA: carboxylating nicotinate-nucleotide diphosphorylase [Flavitalea sp.]|nr:carboxylating nicotinate-nucleotide diphosphorylase [Flavitalea sp.]